MRKTICILAGAFFATSLAAGDQPVISVPMLPPVYKNGDVVYQYMYSQGSGSIYNLATTSTGTVTGPGDAASSNSGVVVTQKAGSGTAPEVSTHLVDDETLYQALLAEAQARGLR